jgi:hypothetical protein
MVHTDMLFYDFPSLQSLGTWNVFVSSSSQNIVILKTMFVSLLYDLFDTVLYCLTYQLLSCINFVVSVLELMASREEWVVGGLAEGEEGFLKSSNRINP